MPNQIKFNNLIDKYLEITNYYQGELIRHIEDVEKIPSRLSKLIESLERTELDEERKVIILNDNETQGQNIVPTKDTLFALNEYKKEILSRLDRPMPNTPRNIAILKQWLNRDVLKIVGSFSTFTLAWDKLVELSRLTLVPDPTLLRIKDNIIISTDEFEDFISELFTISFNDSTIYKISTNEKINKLKTNTLLQFDRDFDSKLESISNILNSRKSIMQELNYSPSLKQYFKNAQNYNHNLALVGLELGFTKWFESSTGLNHRKDLIKSLIYFSKILLTEKSWHKAEHFTNFALIFVKEVNIQCKLSEDEGTAMFICNRFWAKLKLGHEITTDVNNWNTSKLHLRYKFLKFVLLRKFDDSKRILKNLLPDPKSDSMGNISFDEIEEWPILEEFSQTEQYELLKKEYEHL